MSKKYIIIFCVLSIVIGLIYALGLYGSTEVEVNQWGIITMLGGIITISISIIKGNRFIRVIMIFLIVLISMAQVPPIALWITFHGYTITDGTPPSSFVAHWAFAIPHIFIFILGLLSLIKIKK